MAENVRCGIIGCGVIAPTHIECYEKIDGAKLTWLCDIDLPKAKALAEKYGVPNVTSDYREMLAAADLDAVSVCTDHASHSPISIDCLKAGKHVLCEKALSSDRSKLDAMLAEHGKHPGLIFSGVFQHRFDPPVRLLKELIEDGTFGTILTADVIVRCLRTNEYYNSANWRGTWAEEGGAVLINQAIHYIDAISWAMGGVDELVGTHANFTHQNIIEVEDTAVAALRFKSGALGVLQATCASNIKWECSLEVHGSKGGIEIRNDNLFKLEFADKGQEEKLRARFDHCHQDRIVEAGAGHYGFGHFAQICDFVEAIKTERKPFVEAASARHAADIVFALYKSEKERGWVKVGG
ncbi:MAG: Gfo/Idh/MocA family oxidoreductase [Planctomycetes bacterium]|nr:Gfo/Idh/MocA family oxidoreductase [Planctomycetota bacterium]